MDSIQKHPFITAVTVVKNQRKKLWSASEQPSFLVIQEFIN